MAVDILHTGHINIINAARDLGEVTIGLLSDKAIMNYKRLPLIKIEKRKMIIENIKGVKSIIIQDTYDYEPVLRKLKPDYFVHGDDWKKNVQSNIRVKLKKIMKKWNGKVLEFPYTRGVSSSKLKNSIK